MRYGLSGWNVLSEDYRKPNILDGISLEWDYFSIHDKDGKFTGVVAYLVADPMGRLGFPTYPGEPHLMPSGGNIACFGKIKSTGNKYADYENFGLDFTAGNNVRSFFAEKNSGDIYGEMIPIAGNNGEPDKIILRGQTEHFQWELEVTQLWAGEKSLEKYSYPNYDELKDETWVVGNDLHYEIERLEHWTVNMNWPSTKVYGWIKDRTTGEIMDIDAHGYRENSFGRWAFAIGGWDFYFMSDLKNHVQLGFQTYHHDTDDLDYLDVDFIDNGIPKTVRFKAENNELGWSHDQWVWSEEAHQCRPLDATIIGKNDEYTIYADVEIGDDFAVLLSKVTPAVTLYEITTMFPIFSGMVVRNSNDEIVTKFYGQGGGEFSLIKSPYVKSDDMCNASMKVFKHSFPE